MIPLELRNQINPEIGPTYLMGLPVSYVTDCFPLLFRLLNMDFLLHICNRVHPNRCIKMFKDENLRISALCASVLSSVKLMAWNTSEVFESIFSSETHFSSKVLHGTYKYIKYVLKNQEMSSSLSNPHYCCQIFHC